jgi:hypothetical protein
LASWFGIPREVVGKVKDKANLTARIPMHASLYPVFISVTNHKPKRKKKITFCHSPAIGSNSLSKYRRN